MAAKQSTADKPRPYGQATHDLILESAHTLFVKHGVENVSMADIASAAGVSRATVFNQFGAKKRIIDEITSATLHAYLRLLTAALDDTTTPTAAAVRLLFKRMTTGLQQGRKLYKGVFPEIQKLTRDPTLEGPARELRQECHTSLVRLFERGQQRGDTISSVSPANLASAFDALLYGGVTQWLAGPPEASLEPILDDLGALFVHGMQP